jgi:hypothetical protein
MGLFKLFANKNVVVRLLECHGVNDNHLVPTFWFSIIVTRINMILHILFGSEVSFSHGIKPCKKSLISSNDMESISNLTAYMNNNHILLLNEQVGSLNGSLSF